ncbi:MAG TPA: helix-turn-helix transcriptional regulator [Thermoanaerobaculia bacterium]|nr:helix-turn-helix transcriptional regulator [Thermoanaerobaculia bacterium]
MRRKADELIPLEISVLEAALALERRGIMAFHGYSLAKVIKTATDRRMLTAHGTLYRALHRLEQAGLIEAFWEDPTEAERERRPRRRMYRLAALAAVALSRARAQRRGTAGKLASLDEEPETT